MFVSLYLQPFIKALPTGICIVLNVFHRFSMLDMSFVIDFHSACKCFGGKHAVAFENKTQFESRFCCQRNNRYSFRTCQCWVLMLHSKLGSSHCLPYEWRWPLVRNTQHTASDYQRTFTTTAITTTMATGPHHHHHHHHNNNKTSSHKSRPQ